MKKVSYEASVEAAKPVKEIMDAAKKLDVEYLTQALKEMRYQHSFRDSAALLNPSPFTHHEQQELNATKLDQLELMLKLAKNTKLISELTIKLGRAKESANYLSNIFG